MRLIDGVVSHNEDQQLFPAALTWRFLKYCKVMQPYTE